MSPPNCIVLATDLAPRTDRAHDRAVTLARAWRAKLTFVYAIDVAEIPSDEAKEPTAQIVRRRAYRLLQTEVGNARDVTPRVVIDEGHAADARASALNETRAFASRHLGTSVESLNIEVGFGDAAPCIAEYAAQTEADLVLAGTHGRTRLFRVLLGSVALALLDEVPCDVMIVPSKGARSPV